MLTIKFRLLFTTLLALSSVASAAKKEKKEKNLDELVYREFPRRTEEEAAVLEWGHSAVIRYVRCLLFLYNIGVR
jgi:hypothetical protein